MDTPSTSNPATGGVTGTPADASDSDRQGNLDTDCDHDLDNNDEIAGDPPVPITVWRTARTDADGPDAIGARLAARIVSAYSRPGDHLIDLTGGSALAVACHLGGRGHRRAWFTDTPSLVVGQANTVTTVRGSAVRDRPTPRPAAVAEWFGDDLTDPNLPPPDTDPPDLARGAGLSGRTSLVVAAWPPEPAAPASRAGDPVRLPLLLNACRRLLHPGGCLVLTLPDRDQPVAADITPLVTAAAQVGLGYLQHIVAVTADIDPDTGDRFTYYATADLTDGRPDGEIRVLHLRAHHDLVVFTHRPAAADGGARG